MENPPFCVQLPAAQQALVFGLQHVWQAPPTRTSSWASPTRMPCITRTSIGVIYRLQQEQMEILSLLKDAQQKHTEILEMLRHTGEHSAKAQPR
jgi:hypothetical protein